MFSYMKSFSLTFHFSICMSCSFLGRPVILLPLILTFHMLLNTEEKLILIDDKIIFNYLFQPIQRLKPNFTADGIRNIMTQQKQRKQLIFTNEKNITGNSISNQCNVYNLILRMMT